MSNNKEFIDHFKIFDEIDSMVIKKESKHSNKSLNEIKKTSSSGKITTAMQMKEPKQSLNLNSNKINPKNSSSNTKNYAYSPLDAKNKNIKSSEYNPDQVDLDRKLPVYLNNYLYHKESSNPNTGKTRPSSGKTNNNPVNKQNSVGASNKGLLNKNQSKQNLGYGNYVNLKPNNPNPNNPFNSNTKTSKKSSADRFEKLYMDNKKTQNKIQQKRVDFEKDLAVRSIPKIGEKSKNITRDSNNFEERLYPYNKMDGYSQVINNNISNSNINIFVNIDKDDETLLKKYYRKNPVKNYDNFNYHPKISDNSTRIAEKLGSSFERLMKKKKRPPSETRSNKSDFGAGVQISRSSNASKQSGRSGRSTSSSRYIDTNLYQRGLELLKEREKVYYNNKEEKIKQKVNECTFKPKLLKNTSNTKNNNLDIYSRLVQKNKVKEEHLQVKRFQRKKKELEECSFRPKIEELGITDDAQLINKHSYEVQEYVTKKKKIFDKKKEDDAYTKKVFKGDENFVIKPTRINEFSFQLNKNNRHLNRSMDIETKKYNERLMNTRDQFHLKKFFEKKDYGTVSSNVNRGGGGEEEEEIDFEEEMM